MYTQVTFGLFLERVLDDREARAVLDQLGAELVDLGHGQAAVVRHEQRLGRAQPLGQLGDNSLFVLFLHQLTSSKRIEPAHRRAR